MTKQVYGGLDGAFVQHQELIGLDRLEAGLHDISVDVRQVVKRSKVALGIAHLFLRHTSASLLIQENADPKVQSDLTAFFERIAPEGDPLWTHVEEGPDDMPAHVRSALTATTLSIPVRNGDLLLGTWQAVYLFEHRRHPNHRQLVVHVIGQRV